ncbi:hypothetical protein E6O75_ATG06676 [Venturia nashicola]|uniref:Uncharacterized protein n=1 Tax=Venturia nashicola TaxID=86259 RepID=A0A4Z1P516_9PEZI|nr:hypothetical protein E6O75_ATG06676 [Venturia nashicola]
MLHEHATASDTPASDSSAQFYHFFKSVILIVSCIALGIIVLHWILFFAFLCLHWRQELRLKPTSKDRTGPNFELKPLVGKVFNAPALKASRMKQKEEDKSPV